MENVNSVSIVKCYFTTSKASHLTFIHLEIEQRAWLSTIPLPETAAAVCVSVLHSLWARVCHKKIAQMKYILYVMYWNYENMKYYTIVSLFLNNNIYNHIISSYM